MIQKLDMNRHIKRNKDQQDQQTCIIHIPQKALGLLKNSRIPASNGTTFSSRDSPNIKKKIASTYLKNMIQKSV